MSAIARGVLPHKDGGFVAKIGSKYLGYFRVEDDAIAARKEAEILAYGHEQDRRSISVSGGVVSIPLHGRGKFYGYALCSECDMGSVSGIAWTIDGRGYVVGRPAGAKHPVTLHRWVLFGREGSDDHVDHRSGDRRDNRRENLRACTATQNARNTRLKKSNTSGAKGVSKASSGLWRARITVDRREITLGRFATVEAAARAYDDAATQYHGDFACTNTSRGGNDSAVVSLLVEKRYSDTPFVDVRVERA